MRAWRGKVAEQIDDVGAKATGILLPGGDVQLWINFRDPHHAPLKAYIEKMIHTKSTGWKDARLPQQVGAVGAHLQEQERAAKLARDGYVLRGAATVGKQVNNKNDESFDY